MMELEGGDIPGLKSYNIRGFHKGNYYTGYIAEYIRGFHKGNYYTW